MSASSDDMARVDQVAAAASGSAGTAPEPTESASEPRTKGRTSDSSPSAELPVDAGAVPSAGASSEATGEAGAPADEAASASEGQEASEKRVEVSAAYLGELERKAGTADEYLDLLQRVQAEFDNYRKRQRRDLENERRRIKADLLVQLVEILVNLERARDAVAASTDDLAVIEGVELILKQVNDLLAREGAERIVARGRKFDPEEHEALQQMAVDGVEPGVVVEEVSPGVRVDGVVVKAARVIVSA